MKTKLLVQLLQEADPSGELDVCVGKEDIFIVGREPAYYDGCQEVLVRDHSRSDYNVVGAEIRCRGEKVRLRTLPIEWAILEDPGLPVTCPESYEDEVRMWRDEAAEIDREIVEEKRKAAGNRKIPKLGQRVRWVILGDQRIEGTVTAVGDDGVETTQDSPPAAQVWHHGPNAALELVE
jgi:hypothetical protein